MIYFIADSHFNHSKVIEYEGRPFGSTLEMDEFMIEEWNKTVSIDDYVYCLGDMIFDRRGEIAESILSRLNGKLYMIRGNHDLFLKKIDTEKYFEWVKDYHEIKYNHIKFILFHYPIASWHLQRYDSIHLYGHVHNAKIDLPYGRSFNCCADVNHFIPVSIDEIIESFSKKECEDGDNT